MRNGFLLICRDQLRSLFHASNVRLEEQHSTTKMRTHLLHRFHAMENKMTIQWTWMSCPKPFRPDQHRPNMESQGKQFHCRLQKPSVNSIRSEAMVSITLYRILNFKLTASRRECETNPEPNPSDAATQRCVLEKGPDHPSTSCHARRQAPYSPHTTDSCNSWRLSHNSLQSSSSIIFAQHGTRQTYWKRGRTEGIDRICTRTFRQDFGRMHIC